MKIATPANEPGLPPLYLTDDGTFDFRECLARDFERVLEARRFWLGMVKHEIRRANPNAYISIPLEIPEDVIGDPRKAPLFRDG